MTNQPQPPAGYTAEPPTEPGWYRVWSKDFRPGGPFIVMEVWSNTLSELCVAGPFRVTECDGWFWGPRVEF